MRGQCLDHLFDQHFGCGCTGRDADVLDAVEDRPVDIGRTLHQECKLAALALGDLAQTLGVRRIGRTHHDHRIDMRSHLLYRELAIGGGVADVFLVWPDNVRKPLLQMRCDLGRVIDRQRGLRDESQIVGVLRHERVGIFHRLDQNHRTRRQLTHGADHLGMALMADQQNFAAALEMDFRLAVHFRHQRTGRVEREKIAPFGLGRNILRHAMRGKHHRGSGIGNFVEFLDEDRTFLLQAIDDVFVVNDLMPDIDRRAIELQRPLDRVDCPNHAGTKAARRAKINLQRRPIDRRSSG